MTIGRIFMLIVVFAAVAGGYYYFVASGNSTPSAEVNAPEMNPFSAADTEFATFNYEQAINEYRAAIEKAPDSDRVLEAYYRIAASYDELARKDSGKYKADAVAAYDEFIQKYPSDGRTQKARQRKEYWAMTN